jgi:hypothetical protein
LRWITVISSKESNPEVGMWAFGMFARGITSGFP